MKEWRYDPAGWRLHKEFFRALGNPTRFAIVQLLRRGSRHVSQIAEQLTFEQSRVSHNLGCLLNCGFVLWAWKGKNKVYRLNPHILPILAGIEKHLARYAPALEICGVLEKEKAPVVIVPKRFPRQSRRRGMRGWLRRRA